MKPKKGVAVRVQRKLTPAERERVRKAYEETEDAKDEIIAGARKRLAARKAEATALQDVMRLLRSERERRGLSLADIRERTGIERSSLSKLENDADANPTLTTVCRLAAAMGLQIEIHLVEVPEAVASAK